MVIFTIFHYIFPFPASLRLQSGPLAAQGALLLPGAVGAQAAEAVSGEAALPRRSEVINTLCAADQSVDVPACPRWNRALLAGHGRLAYGKIPQLEQVRL